ncbi:MAG: hypothetical protein ACI9FN_000518 [Saprospiraceae bacterium]|jgi:hypothetical protein
MRIPLYSSLIYLITLLCSCSSASSVKEINNEKGIIVAKLEHHRSPGFEAIQQAFESNNPGYAINYSQSNQSIPGSPNDRIVFIQAGSGTATLSSGKASKFTIGDIIILKGHESLKTDSLFSGLIIQVPEEPTKDIPSFIRPDWDGKITDTPGGCATATNAYRRILLTWKKEVGNYVYHGLNAHRVRITDSFSHYHPKKGGFDEFYLVQMVQPNARLITSDRITQIENPIGVSKSQAKHLLNETLLEVGDLIYLPRGVMHRGLGGALAQVITVPGFVPGAEIGVDHHIKKINDNLKLNKTEALPYNNSASSKAIIK